MKHEQIIWNSAIQEWFCLRCGRTSDQLGEPEAHLELERFECHIPWVEMPDAGFDTREK